MAIYINGKKVAGGGSSGSSSYSLARSTNPDVWFAGTEAPENTKLFWIDTDPVSGGLKYYNGVEWVPVPFAQS